MADAPNHYNGYTPEELAEYTSGKKPWPIFEPIEDSAERDKALLGLLWAGSVIGNLSGGRLKIAGMPDWKNDAALYGFKGYGMGGRNGGDGVVLYYRSHPQHTPGIARFAICKHEFVEGAGANHSRGWHPSSCKLCGLDNSIDSGD